METRRILIAEESAGVLQIMHRHGVTDDTPVVIGREGALAIAADPLDTRVSRTALEVGHTPEGWVVRALNRNGVIVQPWGQPAWLAQPVELLASARVALRVLGAKEHRHWVLLEDDTAPTPAPGRVASTVGTELDVPARPLTAPQSQALEALFADLLAWPPVVPGESRQLKQVARQVGVTVSAVQARLGEARAKARSLGLAREVPLTDPEYLYVLVRGGYVNVSRAAVRFSETTDEGSGHRVP